MLFCTFAMRYFTKLKRILIKCKITSILELTTSSNQRLDQCIHAYYYIKVSGIASGNKLIKTIRYTHM